MGATALALTVGAAQALAFSQNGNEITLRMGSGHGDKVTYVAYMKDQFAKNVSERAAKETKYKVKFQQHYGGSLVKVFDTLEGVQDGRLDIGGWCVCFDDDKAMAMNITYYVPFGHPDGNKNLKVMRRIVKEFPEIYQDLGKRYKQRLLAIGGFGNYGLLTAFDWNEFKDLNNHKILAAGPNLPWIEGISIPVRTTIPTAAQQLSTGVGEGIVLFPDTDYKLKFHEAAGKNSVYTVTDFGNIIQNVLTLNHTTEKKLPKEVLKIIEEEAEKWGTDSTAKAVADHQWGLDMLKKAGVKIKTISPEAKKAWATRLKDWPNERAQAVKKKKGIDMPKIMKAYIKYMEEAGHKTPIPYPIKG
jgi:TRAP-type C4-dicarboxylate transport system substrate-binding protein